MKNYPILLIVLLAVLPACLLQAQQPFEVKWSKEIKADDDLISGRIIRADSNGIILVRQKIEDRYDFSATLNKSYAKEYAPVLEFFDGSLNKTHSVVLSEWSHGSKDRWYSFFEFRKKLWLSYSRYLEEAQKVIFYFQEFDPGNHKLTGEPFEIFQVKDSLTKYDRSLYRNSSVVDFMSIGFLTDRLGSKMAFYIFPKPAERNTFKLKVYDNRCKNMWGQDVTLPYSPNQFEIRNFELSSTGSVLVDARLYKKMGVQLKDPNYIALTTRKAFAKYISFVLELSANNPNVDLYHLEMGDAKLVSTHLEEDSDGRLHCLGLYSDKGYEEYSGWTDFVINTFDKSMANRGPYPFPLPLLKKISLKKDIEKQPVLSAFSAQYGLTNDGGSVVAGQYGDWNGAYHVILLRIDSAFQNIDGVRIEKSQLDKHPNEQMFISFSGVYTDSGSFILYNKNLHPEDDPITISHWPNHGSPVHQSIIPPSGEKGKMLFIPASFKGMSDSTRYAFCVESKDHDVYRIGIVTKN